MSAQIRAPLESGAPTEHRVRSGISQTWTVPTRARRRSRRPLAPTLAILGAPALVIAALFAFGALADRSESGLGSLPAASGLQGSAVPAETPEPAQSRKQKRPDAFAAQRSGRERRVQRGAGPRPDRWSRPCANGSCGDGRAPRAPRDDDRFVPVPVAEGAPGSLTGGTTPSGSTSGSSSGSFDASSSSGSGSSGTDSGSGSSGEGSTSTSGPGSDDD